MFDMNIGDPFFQGMIQEQEDKDICPVCGKELSFDHKTSELKCDNCNYKKKVRVRK